MNSLPKGLKLAALVSLNDSCQILLALCIIKIKFKPLSTGIEKNMNSLISKKEISFIRFVVYC